ncbi:DUF2336 domain-containing protein [Blastochloris sulfoviridis]|uniref:DUF2336 domain-containing protein n=1 Tax=Blastochloris sulfoviridis TaxID=50712 RepID=A0A5M6I4W6_9HYPH|nr:DUF2336 domain-containing protein [Blastochloris sulfoviridis]KAA5602845.1 DUF2336 domain-containing protein [Blastochloris sulfoviridis]
MTTRTPNIRGLITLARQEGVDIRPTLVRVITDLYVGEPVHSAAEVERYTELARHMLEAVDEGSRIAVAMKLARYPQAPREILMMLAVDTIAVAEQVLARAHFAEADLLQLAGMLDDQRRRIIAKRADLPASVAEHLVALEYGRPQGAARDPLRPAPRLDAAPDLQPDLIGPDSAQSAETAAPLPWLPSPPAAAPAPASAGRLAPLPLPNPADYAFAAAELEQAALQNRTADFIDQLARVFDLDRAKAEEIVADPTGQPVAIACRALGMSSDAFSRIMLFLDPTIGRSVALVFQLAEYYGRLSVAEAREVTALWRESRRPGGRHVPATSPDGTGRHSFESRRSSTSLPAETRTTLRR